MEETNGSVPWVEHGSEPTVLFSAGAPPSPSPIPTLLHQLPVERLDDVLRFLRRDRDGCWGNSGPSPAGEARGWSRWQSRCGRVRLPPPPPVVQEVAAPPPSRNTHACPAVSCQSSAVLCLCSFCLTSLLLLSINSRIIDYIINVSFVFIHTFAFAINHPFWGQLGSPLH